MFLSADPADVNIIDKDVSVYDLDVSGFVTILHQLPFRQEASAKYWIEDQLFARVYTLKVSLAKTGYRRLKVEGVGAPAKLQVGDIIRIDATGEWVEVIDLVRVNDGRVRHADLQPWPRPWAYPPQPAPAGSRALHIGSR